MTTQATPPTAPTPAPEPRRLLRTTDDRVIAGVAGGLGRYLGIDPVIFRILAVVLIFFGGAGVIAYLVAWLLVPSDDAAADRQDRGALLRRTGKVALVVVAVVVAATFGALWAATGGETTAAIVVIAAGALLVGGGLIGRARWLIAPALALALSASVMAAADVDASGGTGERIYRPASSSDLRPSYRLGIGHLVVDLRRTQLTPGDHLVKLHLGVGGAEVLVSDNVCVSTRVQWGIGGGQVFDRDGGGVDAELHDDRGAPADVPRVIVDADIGIGGLRVQPGEHGRFVGNSACERG
jgi:phage shock protein PspC (stress-responsive transcriptional regulator)